MAKILIVDDDHDILIMVQALMELDGHLAVCFDNSADAIDRARRERFDLIITDANMPPFSGFDLIRTIRAIPTYDFVPIAMLTARKTKKDVERAVLVGAQDYIVKPINPSLLNNKVRELLARSQTAQLAARFGELTVNFEATTLRVQTASTGSKPGTWLIRTSFQALDGRTIGKIRSYLQAGFSRKKAA